MNTPQLPFPLASIAFVILVSFVCGCGEGVPQPAKQKAEYEAIERHEQDVQRRRAMQAARKRLNDSPGGTATAEAMKFLIPLIKSGKLPETENTDRTLFPGGESSTNYPISRTFYLKLKAGGYNSYAVVKNSPDSSWQLQKAGRTDVKGNPVKEYPLVPITNDQATVTLKQ